MKPQNLARKLKFLSIIYYFRRKMMRVILRCPIRSGMTEVPRQA